MEKLFLVTLLILFAVTSYASQKAITDAGKQAILNSDRTSNKYKEQHDVNVKSYTARPLDFGGKSKKERKSNSNVTKKKETDINSTK